MPRKSTDAARGTLSKQWAFAVIGCFLGRADAQQEGVQPLRVFEDVVSLILNNYVEQAEFDRVMEGAMVGLADGLDADSAYLRPEGSP